MPKDNQDSEAEVDTLVREVGEDAEDGGGGAGGESTRMAKMARRRRWKRLRDGKDGKDGWEVVEARNTAADEEEADWDIMEEDEEDGGLAAGLPPL